MPWPIAPTDDFIMGVWIPGCLDSSPTKGIWPPNIDGNHDSTETFEAMPC